MLLYIPKFIITFIFLSLSRFVFIFCFSRILYNILWKINYKRKILPLFIVQKNKLRSNYNFFDTLPPWKPQKKSRAKLFYVVLRISAWCVEILRQNISWQNTPGTIYKLKYTQLSTVRKFHTSNISNIIRKLGIILFPTVCETKTRYAHTLKNYKNISIRLWNFYDYISW